jgi:CubicO group peptidase (beta-lactamase class C family)
LDPVVSHNNMPAGSYYWGGAFGTWFWIDPKNDVVFVGMIQNQGGTRDASGGRLGGLNGDPGLRQESAKDLYAALKDK